MGPSQWRAPGSRKASPGRVGRGWNGEVMEKLHTRLVCRCAGLSVQAAGAGQRWSFKNLSGAGYAEWTEGRAGTWGDQMEAGLRRTAHARAHTHTRVHTHTSRCIQQGACISPLRGLESASVHPIRQLTIWASHGRLHWPWLDGGAVPVHAAQGGHVGGGLLGQQVPAGTVAQVASRVSWIQDDGPGLL